MKEKKHFPLFQRSSQAISHHFHCQGSKRLVTISITLKKIGFYWERVHFLKKY